MPTLNISGRRVTVDDSFLSLTPEQQNATVDEIAASLGPASGPVQLTGTAPINATSGTQRSTNVEFAPGQGPQPPGPLDKLMTSTAATVNGIVNGIPILGPAAQNLTDAIGGTVAQIGSGDLGPVLTPDAHRNSTAFADYVAEQRRRREATAAADPLARGIGEVAGGVGSFMAAGALPAGAEALGLTGKLLPASIASGASTYGIGVGDSMTRGATPQQAMAENLLPAGISALIPGAGEVLKAAGRGINNGIIRPIASAANRDNEAIRRVGAAVNADKASSPIMGAADEAIAQKAGAEVLNADRFGSAIRTLARTASNISNEAKNVFDNATQQRFLTQGGRAVGYVKQLMGGATDDLALQDALRNAARSSNDVAYKAAYGSPKAAAIWTPEIRSLMAADPFKAAIRDAESVGANAAAISGQKAVRNPFVFDQSGNVVGLKKLPDGSTALPNLEFWDIVQRSLRNTAEKAGRAGDNLLASQVQQMRQMLLKSLDGAVPEFKAARQGAAGFFGAEDAIDAGRKAFTTTKATPEIERAVAAMKPAEKDAFSVGFASQLIDTINASRDRVNVINSVFGSQSARDRIRLALGDYRAKELEAYVKVEQNLDLLRNAVQGNSSTARQLIAAGVLGGGAGLFASGGDLTQGMTWASIAGFGRRGLQMLGKSVDDQVMRKVAEMLASGDPKQVERAIQNAAMSQQHMEALNAIMQGLSVAARGAVMSAAPN